MLLLELELLDVPLDRIHFPQHAFHIRAVRLTVFLFLGLGRGFFLISIIFIFGVFTSVLVGRQVGVQRVQVEAYHIAHGL